MREEIEFFLNTVENPLSNINWINSNELSVIFSPHSVSQREILGGILEDDICETITNLIENHLGYGFSHSRCKKDLHTLNYIKVMLILMKDAGYLCCERPNSDLVSYHVGEKAIGFFYDALLNCELSPRVFCYIQN